MECYIALSKEEEVEEKEFFVSFLPPAQNPTGKAFVGNLNDIMAEKSPKNRGFSELDGCGEEVKQSWVERVKKDNDYQEFNKANF